MEAKKARIAQNPSRDIVAFVTASPSSLGLVFFKAGLPCLSRCISTQSYAIGRDTYAKNVILIAIANPACSTTTAMTRILLIFASVTLTTGHRFLTRNTTLTTNPTPVKT